MYTDHSTLKYLVSMRVLGGDICRWNLLLFQEFDFEVVVKPGLLNVGPDQLSRIESGEEPTILEDNFPNVQLFAIHMMDNQNHEFNAIIHFLSTCYVPEGMSTNQKKHLVVKVFDCTLIARHLYKFGKDEILCCCVFFMNNLG